MKIQSILLVAAAPVVAATFVAAAAPATLAHTWRAASNSSAPQAVPGIRSLAPTQAKNEARQDPQATRPLPRGSAPPDAPRTLQPESTLDLAALFTEPDLDLRERSFERVVAQASEDLALRAELDTLAQGGDPALAWTARLALRELRQSPAPKRARSSDPFDALIERLHGADPFGDPFGGRSFDPFGPGRNGGLFGPSPFGSGDPLERMRQQMRQLEEAFDRRLQGPTSPAPAPPTGGQRADAFEFRGHSQSLSVTPDGVRMEVTEDGPDGRTTRTYEAKTLEELYTSYPELRPGK